MRAQWAPSPRHDIVATSWGRSVTNRNAVQHPARQLRRCAAADPHNGAQDAASTTDTTGSMPATVAQEHAVTTAPSNAQAWWTAEVADGTFWQQARSTFPAVPWGPADLVKVLALGIAAAGAFAAADALLLHGLPAAATPHEQALRHLAQEGVLAAVLPSVLWLALVRQQPDQAGELFRARWDARQVRQALLTCAVVFPLVDPVVHSLWAPLIENLLGAPPASSLVVSLQAASAEGSWDSIAVHCFASGVIGPIWEEVFWRGFFLASLTKVLPLPACIALSSANFAVLHLSPSNFLPLLLLSSACDAMYLRWHNLLPPLMLHGLWNTSQILAIAYLGKQDFV